jgi:hypothetical protein
VPGPAAKSQISATTVRPTGNDPDLVNADPSGGITYGPDTLNYYGGRVLHTYETYAVFWDPEHQFDPSYPAGITQYLQDVAHDSGNTDSTYSVLTQYGDHDGPIRNQSTYAGSIVDTDPYPSSGCPVRPTCLTDAQLQTELDSLLTTHGIARPANRIFFLLTPPVVQSCFDDTNSDCSSNAYCAYHSGFNTASGTTLYAVMPDEAGVPGCDDGNRPNGNSADAVITALSHETQETQDDPDGAFGTPAQPYAWNNPNYGESADACYQSFSDLQGPVGAQYNATFNGHHYFIQDEWSDIAYAKTGSGCVRSNDDTGPTPALTVSMSGITASFDATATSDPDPGDSIAKYVWDFGDGSFGSGPAPQHVYGSPGAHTVQLTVADQSGAFMWVDHDIVTPSPCTLPHAILGTAHTDHLVGTPGDDVICGLGGNDTVDGQGGNDVVLGGDGNDTLIGGTGADQVIGGNGNDQLFGSRGNDVLVGGAGTDWFDSGPGDDGIDSTDRLDTTSDSGDTTAETVLCQGGSDDVRFDPYDNLHCASPHSATCAPVTGPPAIPAVTVPGQADCTIDHTDVHGAVTVRSGGALNLQYSRISSLTVSGSVLGVEVAVKGNVLVHDHAVAEFLDLFGHDIAASHSDLYLICGVISGNVTISNEDLGSVVDLDGSNCGAPTPPDAPGDDFSLSVAGSITITNAPTGPILYVVIIGGSIQVRNTGAGGGPQDSAVIRLNTVRGSVTATNDGSAATEISGNTIRGNLVCRHNEPPPVNTIHGVVTPNTVRGTRVGQTCAAPTF